jgi:hypothetical protein
MSSEQEHQLNLEYQLQHFIADNPWLLNLNYERVVELKDTGIEYQVGDQKRADLILRDRVSYSPVVVEFKFKPFDRENVGQILEYKARIATSFNKENSELYRIFKENILAPKLALVVKECDSFTRVACNMAGIDIYEYRNFSEEIKVPSKIVTLKNFAESLRNERMPLSLGRRDELETKVYRPIKRILEEQNLSYAWREPQESRAYFFPQMANLFLNRWLFADDKISMGLYEDVFNTHDVIIAYYSNDKDLLEQFEQLYNKCYNCSLKMEWDDRYKEGFFERKFTRNEFFDGVEVSFKEELNRYLHTMKSIPTDMPVENASVSGVPPS